MGYYVQTEGCIEFCSGQRAISGNSYYAPSTTIYGIAAIVADGHSVQYINSMELRTDRDDLWGLLIVKDGTLMQHFDSVRWHYRSKPDRVWRASEGMYQMSFMVQEFYFDHPIKTDDTFFVCVKRDRTTDSADSLADQHYHLNTIGWVYHTHGDSQLVYVSNRPIYSCSFVEGDYLGGRPGGVAGTNVLPIIVPPDTDAVGCPPPSLRFLRALSGAPWFKYTLSTDEEVLEYQAMYSPLGSDDWDTLSPPSNPFKMGSNLDSTRYYKALFRTKHRHGCPIHDTVYWSPWSDTVLFYSGSTAPYPIGITPTASAEAETPVFRLVPNPSHGEVTVEVAGSQGAGADGLASDITVRDAAGHEVLRQSLSTPTTLLDLSPLPAGTYLVTVTLGEQTGTRRLVVK